MKSHLLCVIVEIAILVHKNDKYRNRKSLVRLPGILFSAVISSCKKIETYGDGMGRLTDDSILHITDEQIDR